MSRVTSRTKRIRNPALEAAGDALFHAPRRGQRLRLDSLAWIDPLTTHVIRAAGSKARFIEHARLSDDEDVRGLVDRRDTLSTSDRSALAITDLCAASNLSFATLLGKVTAAAFEHNNRKSASAMFDLRQQINNAHEDRRNLGFAP